jgi:hypothetical protein
MMFNPLKYPALGICLFAWAACDYWNTDSSALTARSVAPAPSPGCASCHGYPLKDKNHDYHLFKTSGSFDLNGEITCVDCHSTAIRFKAVVLFDTVYEDSTGEKWRTLDNPQPDARTSGGTLIRSLPLSELDTLHRHVGDKAPSRPGDKPLFQEFITAAAHMNGEVDVSFDSKNSRPDKFNGDSASWNPRQESCSAVACHPGGQKPYSFGSKAKGLPEVKETGEEGTP